MLQIEQFKGVIVAGIEFSRLIISYIPLLPSRIDSVPQNAGGNDTTFKNKLSDLIRR